MSHAELEDTRDGGRRVGAHERVWSGPIFTVDDEELVLAEGQEPVRRQIVGKIFDNLTADLFKTARI